MPQEYFALNNAWMLVCTFLVFITHLGFATLESGLVRSKNTVNILFKNSMVVPIGLITYTFWGFSLMYPGEAHAGDFIGFNGFGVPQPEAGEDAVYEGGYAHWTDFLFNAMLAATSATIVSGAVAERVKLNSFLLFSVL